MRLKALKFDREILRKGIQRDDFMEIIKFMPEDSKIVGFYERWDRPLMGIVIESSIYEYVPQGMEVPELQLKIEKSPRGQITISEL